MIESTSSANQELLACTKCGQDTDVKEMRWLGDNTNDMKPYCPHCPEIAIRLIRVDNTHPRIIDYNDLLSAPASPYDASLCLWPTPKHHGLWIRKNGVLIHGIFIWHYYKESLLFIARDQIEQTVCFSVQLTDRTEWDNFRTFLRDK